VILDFEGGTLDQYDQVTEKMGLTSDETPPGALFHFVIDTDDGIRVIDVWETPEQFDQFAREQIGPITQEVGMDAPKMQQSEVHNYLTAAPQHAMAGAGGTEQREAQPSGTEQSGASDTASRAPSPGRTE
jgi:hypothetical protein